MRAARLSMSNDDGVAVDVAPDAAVFAAVDKRKSDGYAK